MRIAITSQNRHQVTDHAGRCRNFWIYDTEADRIIGKALIALDREHTLRANGYRLDGPLAGIQVLITAGMNDNLRGRLEASGVRALITAHTEPDSAVEAFISSRLIHTTPTQRETSHGARAQGGACCGRADALSRIDRHGGPDHVHRDDCHGHGQGSCQHGHDA